MSDSYYKATRPDGTDFRTGTVDYAAALRTGELITHPAPELLRGDASTYLSVSSRPAETLVGGSWPCRLFRVEPHGSAVGPDATDIGSLRYKTTCSGLYVREEMDAHHALGPNGAAVLEFIARIPAARDAAWDAAWDAARDAAWDAARDAAWDAAGNAAWDAAGGAAGDAAGDAARAEVVRDLITEDQYTRLMRPWAILTGKESAR